MSNLRLNNFSNISVLDPAETVRGMKGTLILDAWYEPDACQVRPMASKLINVGEVETFNVVSVSVVIMYPDHRFENPCAQVFI